MRTPTAAAIALMREGITGKELAEALGVSPQAVSYQLAGKTATTSPGLLEAIRTRGSKKLAREVAELIETAREKRAS